MGIKKEFLRCFLLICLCIAVYHCKSEEIRQQARSNHLLKDTEGKVHWNIFLYEDAFQLPEKRDSVPLTYISCSVENTNSEHEKNRVLQRLTYKYHVK